MKLMQEGGDLLHKNSGNVVRRVVDVLYGRFRDVVRLYDTGADAEASPRSREVAPADGVGVTKGSKGCSVELFEYGWSLKLPKWMATIRGAGLIMRPIQNNC